MPHAYAVLCDTFTFLVYIIMAAASLRYHNFPNFPRASFPIMGDKIMLEVIPVKALDCRPKGHLVPGSSPTIHVAIATGFFHLVVDSTRPKKVSRCICLNSFRGDAKPLVPVLVHSVAFSSYLVSHLKGGFSHREV